MSRSEPLIGYVAKMYPRFSETFVVNEIRAREAQGERLEIFSLRLPVDGRFHETLAEVRAPVTYLRSGAPRGFGVWDGLRRAAAELPGLPDRLPELLLLDVDLALQAIDLAVAVRQKGISHLHAHFGTSATSVARMAARLSGVPYSFTAHAKDIFHEEVDPSDLRAKLAGAHHVVTVSDFNARHLRREFPREAGRVHRVYNGIDLDRFARHPGPRQRRVVAVGRLVEKKGFDVLIRAIGLLAMRGVTVPCIIAGDGLLAEPLREQVRASGLDGLVQFAGALPQKDIRELVARSAVLAAPCVVGSDGNADGLPTVLLEGLALGTPCVSTRVTGIPEAIRDRDTGLLVDPGDADGLADALALLLADDALGRRLADAGRALVEAEFDCRAQAAALRTLLTAPPQPTTLPSMPDMVAEGVSA